MDIATRRLAVGYAVPRSLAPADPALPYFALRAATGSVTHCPLTPATRHVLDVTTGTGAWAEDIATLLPWATVWGVGPEIPPRRTLPNFQFVAGGLASRGGQLGWSFIPPWRTRFELIHVAGMEYDLPDAAWPDLVALAHTQLAPGGFLEIVLFAQLVGTPLGAEQFLTPAAIEIFQEWETAYYAHQGITLPNFAHFGRFLHRLEWSRRVVLIPYGVPFGKPGNRAALLLRNHFMQRLRVLLPAFARTLPSSLFDPGTAHGVAQAISLAFHSEALFQLAYVYLARRKS